MSRLKEKKKKKKNFTAKKADRHRLYQMAVQNPEGEVELMAETFERLRGRPVNHIREDFCGTAILAAEWVKAGAERTAVGLDLDPEVLEWGREHNIGPLGEDASRVNLMLKNVMDPPTEPVEMVVAFNYSYFIFKTRNELVDYYRTVHRTLADDGLFMLDAYGGWEAFEPMEDEREEDGFDYTWDQDVVNPIDNTVKNYIHFSFPDGSEMREAFTYDWRLWTLMEIREALEEAGFSKVEVLWEGEDEDGDGNGEFEVVTGVENDPGWNAYIVGVK